MILESDVSYLEDEIEYTKDWAFEELSALAGCTNEYMSAFDFGGFSWYYCSSPLSP
jgi:hypothetical protein